MALIKSCSQGLYVTEGAPPILNSTDFAPFQTGVQLAKASQFTELDSRGFVLDQLKVGLWLRTSLGLHLEGVCNQTTTSHC